MSFIVLLALIIGALVVYKMRVPILAKILGQPERRIERRLNRGKNQH